MKEQHKKESPILSLLGMGGGGTGTALGGVDSLTAADVFSAALYTGNQSSNTIPSGLDLTEGKWLSWIKGRDLSDSYFLSDSTQKTGLCFDSFASDRTYGKQAGETTGITGVTATGFNITGGNGQVNGNTVLYVSWNFKATPGFFDIVTWTGSNYNSTVVNHNLTVVPEMTITKRLDATRDWYVWHKDNTTGNGSGNIRLNLTNQGYPSDGAYYAVPTATQITQGVNNTGNFVAYLFATLPGISKVGSYSGTGNAINVDCGFTGGARFILIKRKDADGTDWYIWDTSRGIASGNDPYLRANSSSVEVTNTDYIDPLSTGFTVTASAPAALNASGGTYIFLAIA